MSPKPLSLLPGALLVADAHYSDRRPELLDFLKSVASGETAATQLILMGDIFDLLFGPIPLTHARNAEAVATINAIAERIEVVYLEGNHDFRLASLFPRVRVFALEAQPVAAQWGEKRVLLAHGDWGSEPRYRLYTALIRSRALLALLRGIDTLTGHGIIKRLDAYLEQKEDCGGFEGFEAHTTRRLAALDLGDAALFIEGHYHQNRAFDVGGCRYVNLGAFACNQRYYEVQSSQEHQPLKEAFFRTETKGTAEAR